MAEGLAPIHAGWNVWSVWALNDLHTEITSIGLSADRRLRLFVENAADAAPGAKVADMLNPDVTHFKGDAVEVIPGPGDLAIEMTKEQVPGPAMLLDGKATIHFVRFFNHGKDSSIAWPHDKNFLVEAVFQPTAENPITSAPAPTNVTNTVEEAAGETGKVLVVAAVALAVVAGVVIAAKAKK